MQFAKIWLCAVSLAVMSNFASAAPVLFERFDYLHTQDTVSTALVPLSNWVPFSGAADTLWITNTGSLTYPNQPATSDPTVALVTTSRAEDACTSFTGGATFSSANSAVYYSLLVKFTQTPLATGGYTVFLKSHTGETNNFYARLWCRQVDSSNIQFGVSAATASSSTSNNPVYQTGNSALNSTYHLVVKYEFVDGTANDVAKLYINPVPGSSEPSTPDATHTNPATDGSVDATTFGVIALRQANGVGTVEIDNIRVGATFADVNPSNAAVSNWTIY